MTARLMSSRCPGRLAQPLLFRLRSCRSEVREGESEVGTDVIARSGISKPPDCPASHATHPLRRQDEGHVQTGTGSRSRAPKVHCIFCIRPLRRDDISIDKNQLAQSAAPMLYTMTEDRLLLEQPHTVATPTVRMPPFGQVKHHRSTSVRE
jgi:hypothetical protein